MSDNYSYPQGEEEEEGEWEVEALLAKRKNKETKEEEFKVLWAGFDGDTEVEGSTSWEPKSWLEAEGYDDLLLKFTKDAKEASTRKQKEQIPAEVQREYQQALKDWNQRLDGAAAEAMVGNTQGISFEEARKAAEKTPSFSKPSMDECKVKWQQTQERERLDQLAKERKYLSQFNPHKTEKAIITTETNAPHYVYLGDMAQVAKQLLENEAAQVKRQSSTEDTTCQEAPTAAPRIAHATTNVLGEVDQKPETVVLNARSQEAQFPPDKETKLPSETPHVVVPTSITSSSYVDTFEGLFLRSGYSLIEPTILRLLGSAQWDVEKACAQQLARDRERQDKQEDSSALSRDELLCGVPRKEKKKKDEDEEEEPEQHDTEGDNFFMLAPTTFHESADVLLVIMSFSRSDDFFNTCKVSRRWRQVSDKMRESRTLVRNFALGLQQTFVRSGMIPIALASAGTDTALLKLLYRQAKQELSDPDYNGRNGGVLVPMHGLQIDADVADGGGQTKGTRSSVKITAEESYFRGPTKYVTTWEDEKPQVAGTASLLDASVTPTSLYSQWNMWQEERQSRTLCLSVGRLPTAGSKDRLNMGVSTPTGCGKMADHVTHYTPGVPTTVSFSPGNTQLAMPVLYIRVLVLDDTKTAQRIANASHTGWRSEVEPGMGLYQLWREVQVRREWEAKQRNDLLALTRKDLIVFAKDEDNLNGGEATTPPPERDMEATGNLDPKCAANGKWQDMKDLGTLAERVAVLWDKLVASVPPPALLWTSFTGDVKTPSSLASNASWFQPPSDKVIADARSRRHGGPTSQPRRAALTHGEIVDILPKANAKDLVGRYLPEETKAVLEIFTKRL